jgi:hypothetical protein
MSQPLIGFPPSAAILTPPQQFNLTGMPIPALAHAAPESHSQLS